MVDRVDLKCNDLVILDTKEYETGPVAVIRLPFSLKREWPWSSRVADLRGIHRTDSFVAFRFD